MFNGVNILYTTDNNGVSMLSVSLYSLLRVKKPESIYYIHIAYLGLNERDIRQLNKIVEYFHNVKIYYYECQSYVDQYGLDKIFQKEKNVLKLHWPPAMYLYLISPLYLPLSVDHIIYLDIDILVLTDLSNLYRNNRLITTFMGVREWSIIPWIKRQNKYYIQHKKNMESYNDAVYTGFNDGKANKYDNYINSGMLLINLERLKKVNYQEVFNLARVHYWPDQDVLCSYFANDILTLPIWDNFCIHYFYDELLEQNVKNAGITTEQVENFEKYANIVHISTRPKPNVLFNAQAYEIIKKYFTDFESYYNIFTYTNEQLDKLIVNYSKQEQTFLKKRLDEYRIALYARAQKTRLYERVFYIWGQLWNAMVRKGLIKYKNISSLIS